MNLNYSFPRYLTAKKTVDDRALNQRVWDALWDVLPPSPRQKPLEILEMGCGTGTMIARILESNRLHHALYTAVDSSPENIATLRTQLDDWARAKPSFMVMPHTADIFAFLDGLPPAEKFDLLIAHAFLDLVDLPEALPRLLARLQPGGLFYFTINFDGETILEPETSHGRGYDAQIIEAYHATMDARTPHGRYAGRRLFAHLRHAGAEILQAGSSDWVVFADGQGAYAGDEAYFLHHILHFFATSLHNDPTLDATQFNAWLAERHEQIERGELVYVAHQLDFLGRVGEE